MSNIIYSECCLFFFCYCVVLYLYQIMLHLIISVQFSYSNVTLVYKQQMLQLDSRNSLAFSIPLHLINYTNIHTRKKDHAFKPRKSESEWYKDLPRLMRCLHTPPSQGRKCSHSSIMGVNRLYQLFFFPPIVSVMFVWLSRFRSKSSALASPGSAPTRACSPSQANGLSMGFLCVLLVTVVTQAG